MATREVDVASSGSPTVSRRRLAAELRRLRGKRTGTVVARALGWSPAKISRFELGQTSYPVDEIEKLADFYGVTDPRRAQLLTLAKDANQRGWWEDFANALPAESLEFVGLEMEATSVAQWQGESVPGLLQLEEYARQIHLAHQRIVLAPPSVIEERVHMRMVRQRALKSRTPPLELSVVLGEAALLRKVGTPELMRAQLLHIADTAELPNVEVRVLPLRADSALMAESFVVFGFGPQPEIGKLGDVVSTETLTSDRYVVEGETDTYIYRLAFEALAAASLSPDESRHFIRQTADQEWA
jgi:transcriptional regulator with XRE-family HTH domain